MEERNWKNGFLARCAWPRELYVDGMRLQISDEGHAAYWDEHGAAVRLGPDDETHGMELAMLPESEAMGDFGDEDGGAKDFADMTQAEAIEAARRCADPETLQGWLLMTRNNQVKGAIKARLAELA